MLLELPLDVLRIILFEFLYRHHRLPIMHVNKRLCSLISEKDGKQKAITRATAIADAVADGHTHLVFWMISKLRYPMRSYGSAGLFSIAADNCRVEILAKFKPFVFEDLKNENIYKGAIKKADFPTLHWLTAHGYKLGEEMAKLVVQENQFEVLEWLATSTHHSARNYALTEAVRLDRLGMVVKLLGVGNVVLSPFMMIQMGPKVKRWMDSRR
jgi:hypothetical protein